MTFPVITLSPNLSCSGIASPSGNHRGLRTFPATDIETQRVRLCSPAPNLAYTKIFAMSRPIFAINID
jgi:hypothetical protein